MDLIIPIAVNRGFAPIETFELSHTGRGYFVQWDTNGMFAILNSLPKENKPDFVVEIRNGRIEVTQFGEHDENETNRKRFPPAVIEAEDTSQIDNTKFKNLVEKLLKTLIEKRDGANPEDVVGTDISSLL